MGRSRNRKINSRPRIEEEKVASRGRKYVKNVIATVPIIFLAWSIFLFTDTFFSLSTLIFIALIGSVIGTICLAILWRNEYLPMWMLLMCGIYYGAPTASFLVFGSNYYLGSHSYVSSELDIVRTGHRLRRKGCAKPYAVVVHNGQEKILFFLCQYEKTISTYKKVRADLSEGLLGFDIIGNPELVK